MFTLFVRDYRYLEGHSEIIAKVRPSFCELHVSIRKKCYIMVILLLVLYSL